MEFGRHSIHNGRWTVSIIHNSFMCSRKLNVSTFMVFFLDD